MKRLLSLLLTAALLVSFACCGRQTAPAEDAVTLRIAGLKGPTSMGMVKLMEDAAAGKAKNTYEFTIAGTADEVTPKLIQGEFDIAAVPVNLASVLYNRTEGGILLLAVNTLGVLSILSTEADAISSVADLAGRTVYATGKGSTPEYTLRYLLAENGLDPDRDVTIEFKSEPAEVVSVLKEQGGVAMLPQPYATVALGSVDGLSVALDLTQEWDRLDNGSRLITGCLVVRRDFAEAHPKALAAFLSEYEASTVFVNEHVEEAAALVEKFEIVKAAVAQKAIPKCNITFLAGSDLRAPVEGYLKTLHAQEPKAVGGKLPGDDFYLILK